MACPLTIAVFVSPHGFGHAARACAVMQAIAELEPGVRFEVFTRVPEWFFADSLACPFRYHDVLTDVGLAQRTALEEDPEATLAQLAGFLPFRNEQLEHIAGQLADLGCALVIADISPLGIAAAGTARLPSVLIENFTWDWIYGEYTESHPAFEAPIAALERIFAGADLRVQTEPVCRVAPGAFAVPPVSRTPRTPREEIRRRLELDAGTPVVLVTMGGVPWEHRALSAVEEFAGAAFVVPGTSEEIERRGSLVALPHRSGFFHPDLVRAADAVVGKLGYSTLAETYAAGIPFAYVSRRTFRESATLASFVAERMAGMPLDAEELDLGTWTAVVFRLISLRRVGGARENGSATVARLALGLLHSRQTYQARSGPRA